MVLFSTSTVTHFQCGFCRRFSLKHLNSPHHSQFAFSLISFSFFFFSPVCECKCVCISLCVRAGPAQSGDRQRTGSGEAGAAGEDGAEDGAVQREGAQGDSGEAARHGAEEQRYCLKTTCLCVCVCVCTSMRTSVYPDFTHLCLLSCCSSWTH